MHEAAAEVLASWNNRLRTLWEKNKGVGAPRRVTLEERVTLRPWSEKGKRFDNPVEKVDARRIERRRGDGVRPQRQAGDGRAAPARTARSPTRTGPCGSWDRGGADGPDYACYVRKK